jgi:uncharacterized membrane protein
MSTPTSIAGHPVHPMLVSLPIGLWVFSLVADIVFLSTGNPDWQSAAYLTLGGGIVGALIAAIPGFIDFLSLHEPQARRTAGLHMVLNLAIVAVYAINFWLRSQSDPGGMLSYWLSVLTVIALVASGWLGGHLVHVLGVTQPHANAGAYGRIAPDRDRSHRHA